MWKTIEIFLAVIGVNKHLKSMIDKMIQNFYSEDILCEKTSAIENCKNCYHKFEFKTLGGVRLLTGVS